MGDYARDISSLEQEDDQQKNIVPSVQFLEKIKLHWMATLDAIDDPIAIIDVNYRIQKSNKAMASLTEHGDVKQIIGEKCHKVFAGRDVPCTGCTAMKALKTDSKQEFVYERSDGKIFEISSHPVDGYDQSLPSVVVQVYRDRTYAKKMQDKIRQHDKLTSLGLLAGGIAHEINNPLSGILLFSQMVLKELSSDDDHYQDVMEIEAAAQRCKEIVQQILDFARHSSVQDGDQFSSVCLEGAIATAMRFAQVLKVAKDTRVIYEWESRDVQVWGSSTKLIQVFLNIFQNAFQAMPDGGELFVVQSSRQVDGQKIIEIEIRDTGIGIAEEHLGRIYDPFFTTKKPNEGSGLGLAICYGMLSEMQGGIHVQSKLQIGTSVCVSLRSSKIKENSHLSAVPNLKDS